MLHFVRLPEYEKAIKDLLTDVEERALETELIENPESGDLIVGGSGIRKIRVGVPGRGKRGGARVIYYYISARGRIYFITAYAKNDQSTLSPAATKGIKRRLDDLRNEP